MRKRLYNFMIDADLADGLKVLKARTGAAESEIIRRALRAWLIRAGVLQVDRKLAGARTRGGRG